jgi:diacylglycerol kinase family enzyme
MSAAPEALVILNPAARHGRGRALYGVVRATVTRLFRVREVELDGAGVWTRVLEESLAAGTRTIIAAGGDGTVGAVTTALARRRDTWPLESMRLGALGLGSSNDFHKPFGALEASVPLRLDLTHARPRDVGRASFVDGQGLAQERFFIVSASLGVTARANAAFNRGGALLQLLRRYWLDGAILLAALSGIAQHRNLRARLRLGEQELYCALSTLSVLKTPYLSGSLRFDTPVAPADGLLAVNLCHGMGRLRLVATLLGLLRGRFAGRPGTRHWRTPRLDAAFDEPADLELDGETVPVREVAFEVLPERIRVCA